MKKTLLLYGAAMGMLLLFLQVIHYQSMIRNLKIEVFGLFVAIIFLGVGIWLGVSLFARNQRRKLGKGSSNHGLSERELEVLILLADGHSNQEIANKLFISLNTTKTHVSNLYRKLNVVRRTQAIQKAFDLNIIISPESSISTKSPESMKEKTL